MGTMSIMATTRIRRGARAHLYIDEWMEDRGLNDEKVANRLGVTRQTIWKWRKEQHRLDPGKIAQLATALDCEPYELWRPPGLTSLDAIVADAPEEVRNTAADIVRRLVSKG